MTTTDHLQKIPTFYTSLKECDEQRNSRIITNQRYNYTHFCFTAGDIDQFETYRDMSSSQQNQNNDNTSPLSLKSLKSLNQNRWSSLPPHEQTSLEKYKNVTTETVDNTFRYLFEKFKKGIFIKIKNNKLSVFLPFSKNDYVNEWSGYMKQPDSFKSMTDFLIYSSQLQGYQIDKTKINQYPNRWYANNCLIRTEYPITENDRGLSNIKDMLETLCEQRELPDLELFINKRDFPLLTRLGDYEPYDHIYGTELHPLTSHRYNKHIPILSTVSGNFYADIAIPTAEDWARVQSQEKTGDHYKYFAPDCKNYNFDFSKPWNERIPTAVFRGSSTGCGTTPETNPRLKASILSTQSPIDENAIRYLDAGITKWNLRPRKHRSSTFLQLIDTTTLPPLVSAMSPEQQANYKYILHLDGHVSAFRLSLELSMGCVILIQESKYQMWFRKYLTEGVHYLSVKEDLSDLFDKIKWCKEHDEECEIIAQNARDFYNEYLRRDGILDYLQLLFFQLKQNMGEYFYNKCNVQQLLREHELSYLSLIYKDKKDNFFDLSTLSQIKININRNYPAMRGLKKILQEKRCSFDDYKSEILHETRDTKVSVLKPFSQLSLLIKQTTRNNEWVNEAFCGINRINALLQEIPHFRFTYGVDIENQTVISEHIEGPTFKKFISDGCSLEDFISILEMIILALAVAQERFGFVHYDLYPWNIIIHQVEKPILITYQFKTYVFTITTRIVPIIIDYGRSHVISKDERHYGTIEPFKTILYQDCFCLLVSSIAEIASRTKQQIYNQKDTQTLMNLLNFYAKTNLLKQPIEKYKDLLGFISVQKKYNEMIYGNKCDLIHKDPTELIFYFLSLNLPTSAEVKQIIFPSLAPLSRQFNHPLYYDLFLHPLSIEASTMNYLNEVEKMVKSYKNNVNNENNELSTVYTQSIINFAINGVLFFNQLHLSSSVIYQKCQTIISLLSSLSYSSPLRVPYFSPNDELCVAKYSPKTFSVPEKILTILQGSVYKKNSHLISYREMFIYTSLYNVPYRLSQPFFNLHKKIINLKPLTILNHNANMNTVAELSKEIYEKDLEFYPHLSDQKRHVLQSILSLIF